MRWNDNSLVKVVKTEVLEITGDRFTAEFGEVWLERIGCDGTELIDSNGSEATIYIYIERHSMAESKRRLKGGSKKKAKLEMMRKLLESELKAQCVWIDCKRLMKMMARLRRGTAEPGIEVRRGVRREIGCVKTVKMGRWKTLTTF